MNPIRALAIWITTLAATLAGGCGGGGGPTFGNIEATWGSRGLMPGQFTKPRAIAIDDHDRIYVVDMRAMIQVLDADGNCLESFETPTHELGRPSGLAIDTDGNLLVADSHYHRVLVYSPEGKLLRQVGGDQGSGPLAGRFGYLADIALDSKGNWYVAEAMQNERITKLDPKGNILAEWGGRGAEPGQFQRIRALAIDADDQLYVADSCNHRIQVFSPEGKLVRVIGGAGDGPGEFSYPFDVAIGPEGSLYVVEYGNSRIQRLTREGKPQGIIGKQGRGRGELFNPWALAVSKHGRLFVIDTGNNRVHRVKVN